jgi:hypothetical protein
MPTFARIRLSLSACKRCGLLEWSGGALPDVCRPPYETAPKVEQHHSRTSGTGQSAPLGRSCAPPPGSPIVAIPRLTASPTGTQRRARSGGPIRKISADPLQKPFGAAFPDRQQLSRIRLLSQSFHVPMRPRSSPPAPSFPGSEARGLRILACQLACKIPIWPGQPARGACSAHLQ